MKFQVLSFQFSVKWILCGLGALALVKKFGLVGGGQMRPGFCEILLCAGYIAQFVLAPL